jgi:hypothetical protein
LYDVRVGECLGCIFEFGNPVDVSYARLLADDGPDVNRPAFEKNRTMDVKLSSRFSEKK